ncbi:MAG: type II/IV secretion system protein [Opitutales bacterium]|nr:type II/IV secretion system protein [Opitutales bacterium]
MQNSANNGDIFERVLDFLNLTEPARGELRLMEAPARPLALLEKSGLSETELMERLAEMSGLECAPDFKAAADAQKIIPIKVINEYQCLPLGADSSSVSLAVALPPDADMAKWIKAVSGKTPKWVLAPAVKISEAIAEKFGVGADSLSSGADDSFAYDDADNVEEDENAAIIKFVNEIISRAMSDRATDIHIEPQSESLNIRYRIDGSLVPVRVPDNLLKFKDAIISRIKIMARLNISERRRPQDGRIGFTMKSGEEIDIRISSLPTMYGESVSLRLLSKKTQPVGIEDLGFLPDDIEKVSKPLARPHGIILVTGPTGSGKSTTLTAFIRKLRSPKIRIITVEDPVEYEVEGVNQTQVHPEIGLTFSSVLRSVLRQDPDVIMIGEIRDRETADIAIRASLTGHLVLSTLHTNDAAGAFARLIDMDIEPFLISSSIEMVMAQRLVRKLCFCKTRANLDAEYLASCIKSLNIDPSEIKSDLSGICKPVGCQHCRGAGYRGRLGIFEIILASDELKEAVLHRKTAAEIRLIAEKYGMRTLQKCGW